MSKVYGEPVDVWVRNGRPARFVWRGRLYTVFGVMDHWVVSREWWGESASLGDPRAGMAGDPRVPAVEPGHSRVAAGNPQSPAAEGGDLRAGVAGGPQAPDAGGSQGLDAGGSGNHEFWRVEASPGQNARPATYELRLDAVTGNWLLARVWD